jgi:hypothetical protein
VERFGSQQPHLRRLTERLLEILSEDGILARGDSDWETIQIPADMDPQIFWDGLSTSYPDFDAELGLVGQCAPHLADILGGKRNALDILFPQGSFANVERVYQDAPFAQAYNSLTAQTVEEILAHFPRDRKVRILEIGAGTGGTTAFVLPKLDPSRAEYLFSDLSPHFTFKASEKFERIPL